MQRSKKNKLLTPPVLILFLCAGLATTHLRADESSASISSDNFLRCEDNSPLEIQGELGLTEVTSRIARLAGVSPAEFAAIHFTVEYTHLGPFLGGQLRLQASASTLDSDDARKIRKVVERFVRSRCCGHSLPYVLEFLEQDASPIETQNSSIRRIAEKFPNVVVKRLERESRKENGGVETSIIRDGWYVWRYGMAVKGEGGVVNPLEEVVPAHEYLVKIGLPQPAVASPR